MNFYGITDSLAVITRQPSKCPHCQIAVFVSNGLCLRCLLQAGLTEDEGQCDRSSAYPKIEDRELILALSDESDSLATVAEHGDVACGAGMHSAAISKSGK